MPNEDMPLEPDERTPIELVNFFSSTLANSYLHDVNDEEDFKKIKQNSWKEHSTQYTELLTNYVNNSKETLKIKQSQKKWFFFISMTILLLATMTILLISENQYYEF